MKKKILFIIITILFVPHVKAECDNNRVNELRSLAKNIEITYELDNMENIINDKDYSVNDYQESIPQGNIKIIISGVVDGLIVRDETYNRTFSNDDFDNGVLILRQEINGSRTFKVYSSECDNKNVRIITMKIPRYNEYYTDPLCDGISGNDLSVCSMWYEKEIDYDTFKQKVEEYKTKLELNKKQPVTEDNNMILDFIKNYYIYIILSIILIISLVVVIKIRRKRSVLE